MLPVGFVASTLVSVWALIAHILRVGARRGAPRVPGEPEPAPLTRDEMRAYVWWHSFYVNPADPRGWVPKTFGYGWTVNLRTKRNVQVFVALLGLTVASAAGLVFAALCR